MGANGLGGRRDDLRRPANAIAGRSIGQTSVARNRRRARLGMDDTSRRSPAKGAVQQDVIAVLVAPDRIGDAPGDGLDLMERVGAHGVCM